MNRQSKNRLSRLNKRQQKKLLVGAYQELGFGILFQFKADTDPQVIDSTLDAVLSLVDEEGATFGGYCNGQLFEGMVMPLNRQVITAESRQKVIDLLATFAHIEDVQVSEFVDAWYD